MADKDARLKALQQQGTLNSRPQDVRDALFHQHDFFDPRDLVQVKYEMLRRVQAEGKSVTDTSADFGLSRPSFYASSEKFVGRRYAPMGAPEARLAQPANPMLD